MKIIERHTLTSPEYLEIMNAESHHKHEIYEDERGVYRWVENRDVKNIMANISMNDICPLLCELGYGKNSEVYRKLYRDIGYSLSGYWEIFYWELNNDEASEYAPLGNV